MNYQELEKVLQGPLTYTNTSDKKLIEHFQEKFKMVPYNNDFLFIFHHEREFENKNHIISLHQWGIQIRQKSGMWMILLIMDI